MKTAKAAFFAVYPEYRRYRIEIRDNDVFVFAGGAYPLQFPIRDWWVKEPEGNLEKLEIGL